MTAEQKNTRDWVDLALLAAIGVLAIGLLLAVPVMRQAPYDTIMYVHFLWRRAWLAIALVVLAMLACLRVWSWRGDTHTSRKKRYLRGLDGLLLLSVGVLPVLLFWPPREAGHDPLRPGAQVCRQYPAPGENRTDAARPPINYLAYLPAEYTASRRWPLVVFLHGSGGRRGKHGGNLLFVRAEGLPNQVERGKQFPFILVSPQSPGAGWRPSLVVELIDYLLRNLPVDPDRVYLTGNSMGGIGTWQVASHYPERFAAIVPLCGGGDVRLARELVNMPIWAFHGRRMTVCRSKWAKPWSMR